jgi:hypothetical protein
MRKIPIVVTAYCDGEGSEIKIRMAEKLCQELNKTGHYVCLATHSTLPQSVQKLCNAYIYDSDNDFHIDGLPVEGRNHGIAEIKSVHNALNYLERFGFKEFFKVSYDIDPTLPFNTIIERAQFIVDNYNKEFVGSGWGDNRTLAALTYYSTFDFFRKITPLETPEKYKSCFEVSWFLSAEEKGVLDKVYISHIRLYDDFLGFVIRDYSHQAGTEIDYYPH